MLIVIFALFSMKGEGSMKKRDVVKKIASLFFVLFFVYLHSKVIFSKKVTLDNQQCITLAQQELLKNNCIDALYFTPDNADLIKYILIGLIEAEKEAIFIAVYRLTDTDITQAVLRAKYRGVKVEVVVDSGALSLAFYTKVHILASANIPLYVYQAMSLRGMDMTTTYKSIMHQKTFIFKNTIGGHVVMFGSLNPTHAAFHGNEEVVQFRNANAIVCAFEKHFNILKNRSHQYTLKSTIKLRKIMPSVVKRTACILKK